MYILNANLSLFYLLIVRLLSKYYLSSPEIKSDTTIEQINFRVIHVAMELSKLHPLHYFLSSFLSYLNFTAKILNNFIVRKIEVYSFENISKAYKIFFEIDNNIKRKMLPCNKLILHYISNLYIILNFELKNGHHFNTLVVKKSSSNTQANVGTF